jgi:hypothetical protein
LIVISPFTLKLAQDKKHDDVAALLVRRGGHV